MKKKGNKMMSTPRHKVIRNPIPISLFCYIMFFCLCVVNTLGKEKSTKRAGHQFAYMKFIVVLKETKM